MKSMYVNYEYSCVKWLFPAEPKILMSRFGVLT